jgi:hypothetical protein
VTSQNLSDEDDVSKDLKPLRFVAMSPTKQGQKGRVVKVKSNGPNDEVDVNDNNNNKVRTSGNDEFEDQNTPDSEEELEGEDQRAEYMKTRQKCLKVAQTVSTTLRDLVRLIPPSGGPSSVSSVLGLNLYPRILLTHSQGAHGGCQSMGPRHKLCLQH